MSSVIDRIASETERFHADADVDSDRLMGVVTPAEYLRFLARMYGFVGPLERSLVQTPGLGDHVDLRRFQKHELLRRDLRGFRLSAAEVERLPQCSLPVFDSVPEALGWAYVIERSTLFHPTLFRHLAMVIPGEVAFTSSYLKCYFGSLGETWRSFATALDLAADTSDKAQHLIDAAIAAFRRQSSWRRDHDDTIDVPRIREALA